MLITQPHQSTSANTRQVVSPFQAILDYELSHNIPPGWVNHCISRTKPNGFWHRLERGEVLMNADWFSGFNSDLHKPSLWKDFYSIAATKNPSLPKSTPPLPKIDGEYLFWEMMGQSRSPDPWMYPALKALKASGKYIIAALSNTMIFPPDHPYASPASSDDVRSIFDIFISSAHVGCVLPLPSNPKPTNATPQNAKTRSQHLRIHPKRP